MVDKIFKGFALSISMLSTLPFFKVHDFFKGINGYGVMFYPLVGLLLGFILYGVALILEPYTTPLHLGVILLALWVLLSGALHLDGLSDTTDGFFVPKERALEVMKDPHAGGMGMIFSVVFLLLKAATLCAFEAYYLLPLVLMLGRFNIVLAIYVYPYITPNGMSSLAKEELNISQVLVATLYVVAFSILWQFSLLLLSLVVLWLLQRVFIKRYGGLSGDMYGFIIEITELVLLNAIVIGSLG